MEDIYDCSMEGEGRLSDACEPILCDSLELSCCQGGWDVAGLPPGQVMMLCQVAAP